MKGLHRAVSLVLIPLLVALMVAPVAASPGNGTPKTNQEHESWLKLDPVPESTDATSVTISGQVAGNFDMKVENGTFVKEFQAKGHFSVTVDLLSGENRIRISGIDRANRLLNYEFVIFNTGTGTGGEPSQVTLSTDGASLVANGRSQLTVQARVTDINGALVTGFNSPITFVSSNPITLKVLTPQVIPVGGIAVATLRAGDVPGEATITASGANFDSVGVELVVVPQIASYLVLSAEPKPLAKDDPAGGLLYLELQDQAGLTMQSLPAPVNVHLVSSNPAAVHFGAFASTKDVSVTQAVSQVPIYAGTSVGISSISAIAESSGGVLGVTSTIVETALIGVPTSLVLQGGDGLVANGVSQSEVSVTIMDENGAPARLYNGPVTFSTSNPSAIEVLTSTVTAANGVAAATIKAGTTGQPGTITATVPGGPSASIQVTPAAQITSSVVLENRSGRLPVGGLATGTLLLILMDQTGVPMWQVHEPVQLHLISDNAEIIHFGAGAATVDLTFSAPTAQTSILAGMVTGVSTVTGTATSSGRSIPVTPVSLEAAILDVPARIDVLVASSLVANNQSTTTLTAAVIDAAGGVAREYTGAITFKSSNPAAVQVLTSTVVPVSGAATVTLKAGATAAPVVITVSAVGLPETEITITPEHQIPSRLILTGNPSKLAKGGTSRGTLELELKDQTGADMLALGAPVQVQLVTSNPSSIHFGSGAATANVTMTQPHGQVGIYGGLDVGSAQVTGTAQSAENPLIVVQSVQLECVVTGFPVKFTIDPIAAAQVGTPQVAFVRLIDTYGNQVSTDRGRATVELVRRSADGSELVLGTVQISYGVGSLTFTTSQPGTYVLVTRGTWAGYEITPGQVTFTVTP